MKYDIEIIKVCDGYIIRIPYHKRNEGGGIIRYYPSHYISGYRNGIYKYTTDYTCAKHYSKITAQKHAKRIKTGENI